MSTDIYGLMARFETAERLVEATHAMRDAGYVRMDAYAPFPVEGLSGALGFRRNAVPAIMLGGGVLGGAGAYFMQVYAMAYDYPLDIGGRPLHSWPAFIPITFELTVLSATLLGLLGMLALNGLPRLHHPVFSAAGFDRASIDGFFLCIERSDEKFSPTETRARLEDLGAVNIEEVPLE